MPPSTSGLASDAATSCRPSSRRLRAGAVGCARPSAGSTSSAPRRPGRSNLLKLHPAPTAAVLPRAPTQRLAHAADHDQHAALRNSHHGKEESQQRTGVRAGRVKGEPTRSPRSPTSALRAPARRPADRVERRALAACGPHCAESASARCLSLPSSTGSRMNTSAARSGSRWLSLMKPITRRPSRCSIKAVASGA